MSDKANIADQRKSQGRKKKDPADTNAALPVQTQESRRLETVKSLATEHPFALLAGGLVIGVLAGALFPRRQAARLSKPLLAVAGMASEAGLAYAQKALSRAAAVAEDASAGGGKLLTAARDRAEALSGSAAEDTAPLIDRASAAAETVPEALRDSGRRIAQSVVRLTSQLRH